MNLSIYPNMWYLVNKQQQQQQQGKKGFSDYLCNTKHQGEGS